MSYAIFAPGVKARKSLRVTFSAWWAMSWTLFRSWLKILRSLAKHHGRKFSSMEICGGDVFFVSVAKQKKTDRR